MDRYGIGETRRNESLFAKQRFQIRFGNAFIIFFSIKHCIELFGIEKICT